MEDIFHIINTVVKDKRLKHSEVRVFMVLVSYNGKRNIFPSQNRISNDSGIKSISDISKMLKKLAIYGYIKITKRKHQSNIYEILNINKGSTKDRVNEGNTDDSKASIPDCLNNEEFIHAWEKWKAHRKELKKKLTPTTEKQQLLYLAKQTDPIKVIENSILNGWQRLFEIKQLNFYGIKERRNKQQEYFAKETY